jgi:hypothetical protein
MRVRLSLLCVATAISWGGLAHSEPITFTFTGHVIATNKPAVFPLSQTILGQYTFESTTPDANPGNLEQGVYDGALVSFSFTSGSYAVLADEGNSANGGGEIIINRNSVFDEHQYQVFLIRGTSQVPLWGPNVGGEQLVRMWIRLIDANRTAITGIALPLTPPNLSDFTSNTFGLIFEFDPTGDPGVVFQLDTLQGVPTGIALGSWGRLKKLYLK